MDIINKKPAVLSIILIIALGFVVYGNALNIDFFWDDDLLITNNEQIKNWSNLPHVFTKDIDDGTGDQFEFYRPLQMATYMLDYSVWQLNPFGYHLTNLTLHITVALSLYWLIMVLFNNQWLSLLTGALFVIHPIHVEAVTYIAGRADSLAALFMLLCFICYIKSSPSTIVVNCLMALSYALALLSRENSLILPALILIYHASFRKKVKIKAFLLLSGMALIYLVLRGAVLKSTLAQELYTTTVFQRLPGFFVAVASYFKLLFLPFHLHMEYGNGVFQWGNPIAILGLILALSSIIYAFRVRERRPFIFFSVGWFFVALIPVSNLFPINAYMAEHWMYVPSIGFFLICAQALQSLYMSKSFKIITAILGGGLVLFYSSLTVRQNTIWQNPIGFFEHTLKYAPENASIYTNLGLAYAANQRNEDAIVSYQKAIEIKPDEATAYFNLGNSYKALHHSNEAVAAYSKAIEIKPNYLYAYNNLGYVYHVIKKYEQAIESYQKAIEIKPDGPSAYFNLGNVYRDLKNYELAVAAYKQAIEINPNYADVYVNLGNVYRALKNNTEAMAAYMKALEIDPDFVEAYNNLAIVYSALGRKEEAVAAYKRAIVINPDYVDAYMNLAIIHFNMKQIPLAKEFYNQAKIRGFSNPAFEEAFKGYEY